MGINAAYAPTILAAAFEGTTFYLALRVNGAEVSGGGYARKAFSFTASGTEASNVADIEFDDPSGAWGEIDEWAVYTAVTGGTLVASEDVPNPETVGIGDAVVVPAGVVRIEMVLL